MTLNNSLLRYSIYSFRRAGVLAKRADIRGAPLVSGPNILSSQSFKSFSAVSKSYIYTAHSIRAAALRFEKHCRHYSAPVAEKTADGITHFLLADIGEGITECEIIQWFVREGDEIAQFDKICEVQSDKAAVEISSRFDGVIKKLHYKVGDMAKVGKPLVDILEFGSETTETANPVKEAGSQKPEPAKEKEAAQVIQHSTPSTQANSASGPVLATPAVRRLSKENNVDLSRVKGTGKDGRILKEDILALIQIASPGELPSSVDAHLSSRPVPAIVSSKDELVPLSAIQKAMFKQMTKSLKIPHFGYADEVVMNESMKLRASINHYISTLPPGTYPFKKITYMAILIKALSLALKEYPILNACIVEGEQGSDDINGIRLKYRSAHNIGIAMDTPQGLLVPNVKNVESKSILDVAVDLHRLVEVGRKGALAVSDLSGGTITVSNIGNVGGTYLHPVIVSSEVCIGAIGRIKRLPRFETIEDVVTGQKSEQVVPKDIMAVSWNADHRVIDGATMARFVEKWKMYLENPTSMMTHLK